MQAVVRRNIARTQQSPRILCDGLRAQHRNFVSSVLLSRTWENELVVDLKNEAKKRGLSQKGAKSVLVARLQEFESSRTFDSGARDASTQAAEALQAASPGIPPASQPPSALHVPKFMNVQLPDISKPDPEQAVQIPYVPDFWKSSPVVHEPTNVDPPKLLVVAGSATHHGGGPSHHLHDNHEVADTHTQQVFQEKASAQGGLWNDIAEDLGLPTSLTFGQTVSEAEQAFVDTLHETTAAHGEKSYSRSLDKDEVRGVWVLFGLLGGSWILSGLLDNATPAVAADKAASPTKH